MRSPQEVEQYRKENEIQVFGNDLPNPVTSFEEAGLPDYLEIEIQKAGFAEPRLVVSYFLFPLSLKNLILVVRN